MRVFVAGATGAVGKMLIPLLVSSGHEVVGMTRSKARGLAPPQRSRGSCRRRRDRCEALERVPVWRARLIAGELAVVAMTQIRGVSNAKAKRELGWEPTFASWRDGFRHGLFKDQR